MLLIHEQKWSHQCILSLIQSSVVCCGGVLIHIAKPEYFILGKLKSGKVKETDDTRDTENTDGTCDADDTDDSTPEHNKKKQKQKKHEHRRRKMKGWVKVREVDMFRLTEDWVSYFEHFLMCYLTFRLPSATKYSDSKLL